MSRDHEGPEGGTPPRLDARGMPVDPAHPLSGASRPEPPREEGPSVRLPALVAVVGAVPLVLAIAQLLRTVPAPDGARPMIVPVLAAALAVGGFSATRVLQLWHLASSRRRRADAGEELPEVRRQLTDAHSLHVIWLLGVSGSVVLMGLLGLWSVWGGIPSGLEPGWPLLLGGAALAGGTQLVRRRLEALWEQSAG